MNHNSRNTVRADFLAGLKHGIPIAIGYLFVSFGFGIMAAKAGYHPLLAIAISATNLTSAGQVAGLDVMIHAGPFSEMALTQLVINLRYALMALTLSQKTTERFGFLHRLITSFGITDEIFAVASTRNEPASPPYLYGLILLPFLGWTGGTALGAELGSILPAFLTDSLGILLYGMFIAIVLPVAKKERGVCFTAVIAAALSVLCACLIPDLGSGFSVILCSILAATAAALLFPASKEEEEGGDTI